MQSLNMDALDRLDESWADLLQRLPSLKRVALETAGAALLQEVRRQAGASGMRDGGAKVAGWQRKYLGSKGGYTAVRAMGGQDGGGTGANSTGAITNYTENGHKIRRPSGQRKPGYRYRPRIHSAAVRGYHFYYYARDQADNAVREPVDDLKRKIVSGLGGEDA